MPRAHTSRANNPDPLAGDGLECHGRTRRYILNEELEEFPMMPDELKRVMERKGVIEHHPPPKKKKEEEKKTNEREHNLVDCEFPLLSNH